MGKRKRSEKNAKSTNTAVAPASNPQKKSAPTKKQAEKNAVSAKRGQKSAHSQQKNTTKVFLPLNIWRHIFSYLPFIVLQHSVASVQHNWRFAYCDALHEINVQQLHLFVEHQLRLQTKYLQQYDKQQKHSRFAKLLDSKLMHQQKSSSASAKKEKQQSSAVSVASAPQTSQQSMFEMMESSSASAESERVSVVSILAMLYPSELFGASASTAGRVPMVIAEDNDNVESAVQFLRNRTTTDVLLDLIKSCKSAATLDASDTYSRPLELPLERLFAKGNRFRKVVLSGEVHIVDLPTLCSSTAFRSLSESLTSLELMTFFKITEDIPPATAPTAATQKSRKAKNRTAAATDSAVSQHREPYFVTGNAEDIDPLGGLRNEDSDDDDDWQQTDDSSDLVGYFDAESEEYLSSHIFDRSSFELQQPTRSRNTTSAAAAAANRRAASALSDEKKRDKMALLRNALVENHIRFPHLTSIHLHYVQLPSAELFAVCMNYAGAKLQKLRLDDCNARDSHLFAVAQFCPNLHKFSVLCGEQVTLRGISKIVHSCVELRSLIIAECSVKLQHIGLLAKNLRCTKLNKISLSGFDGVLESDSDSEQESEEDSVEQMRRYGKLIGDLLRKMPALKKITLGECPISDDVLWSLSADSMPNLSKLIFEYSSKFVLTSSARNQSAKAVTRYPKLKTLCFNGCRKVTDELFIDLLDRFGSSSLCEITMNENILTHKSLTHLMNTTAITLPTLQSNGWRTVHNLPSNTPIQSPLSGCSLTSIFLSYPASDGSNTAASSALFLSTLRQLLQRCFNLKKLTLQLFDKPINNILIHPALDTKQQPQQQQQQQQQKKQSKQQNRNVNDEKSVQASSSSSTNPELMNTFSQLEELCLSECDGITDEFFSKLANASVARNVKTLIVECANKVSDEMFPLIAAAFPQLRSLEVSDCSRITRKHGLQEGLRHLVLRCSEIKTLTGTTLELDSATRKTLLQLNPMLELDKLTAHAMYGSSIPTFTPDELHQWLNLEDQNDLEQQMILDQQEGDDDDEDDDSDEGSD